jgi:hypothetical protein
VKKKNNLEPEAEALSRKIILVVLKLAKKG